MFYGNFVHNFKKDAPQRSFCENQSFLQNVSQWLFLSHIFLLDQKLHIQQFFNIFICSQPQITNIIVCWKTLMKFAVFHCADMETLLSIINLFMNKFCRTAARPYCHLTNQNVYFHFPFPFFLFSFQMRNSYF